VVGGSEDGGADAQWKNGGRSSPVRGGSELASAKSAALDDPLEQILNREKNLEH
jgi:hypothetical protein